MGRLLVEASGGGRAGSAVALGRRAVGGGSRRRRCAQVAQRGQRVVREPERREREHQGVEPDRDRTSTGANTSVSAPTAQTSDGAAPR